MISASWRRTPLQRPLALDSLQPRLVLPITRRAVVLDRGSVVDEEASEELLADPRRLDRWLVVAAA